MPMPKAIRLLGVSLSSLQNEADIEPQLDLPIYITSNKRARPSPPAIAVSHRHT